MQQNNNIASYVDNRVDGSGNTIEGGKTRGIKKGIAKVAAGLGAGILLLTGCATPEQETAVRTSAKQPSVAPSRRHHTDFAVENPIHDPRAVIAAVQESTKEVSPGGFTEGHNGDGMPVYYVLNALGEAIKITISGPHPAPAPEQRK